MAYTTMIAWGWVMITLQTAAFGWWSALVYIEGTNGQWSQAGLYFVGAMVLAGLTLYSIGELRRLHRINREEKYRRLRSGTRGTYTFTGGPIVSPAATSAATAAAQMAQMSQMIIGASFGVRESDMEVDEDLEESWTPNYVRGWRQYEARLNPGSAELWSHQGTPYTPNPAVCLTHTVTYGSFYGPEEDRDNHSAPYDRCYCGYYAYSYYEPENRRNSLTSDRLGVDAEVRMWGDIIEHEKGYRSQYMEVVRLYVPLTEECDLSNFWMSGLPTPVFDMEKTAMLLSRRYQVPVVVGVIPPNIRKEYVNEHWQTAEEDQVRARASEGTGLQAGPITEA